MNCHNQGRDNHNGQRHAIKGRAHTVVCAISRQWFTHLQPGHRESGGHRTLSCMCMHSPCIGVCVHGVHVCMCVCRSPGRGRVCEEPQSTSSTSSTTSTRKHKGHSPQSTRGSHVHMMGTCWARRRHCPRFHQSLRGRKVGNTTCIVFVGPGAGIQHTSQHKEGKGGGMHAWQPTGWKWESGSGQGGRAQHSHGRQHGGNPAAVVSSPDCHLSFSTLQEEVQVIETDWRALQTTQ